MPEPSIKKSIFAKIRNNFIAGVVVLIPIGITLYLTLFIIRISSNVLPKEINPNNYLPFDIPGVEILIALVIITLIGWLSLSFLGKKFFELFKSLKIIKDLEYSVENWNYDKLDETGRISGYIKEQIKNYDFS